MSVNTNLATQRYIPEDSKLQIQFNITYNLTTKKTDIKGNAR